MRRALLTVVSTLAGLVLLLGFKSQSPAATSTPPAALAAPSTGSGTASTGTAAGASRTVTGSAVDTRFGPVQVQVTVAGSKLTGVTVVQAPSNSPRDQQINGHALPVLNREALAANSAHIDMVSGATFTSVGYIQSLQSALDKAGI